MPIVQLWHSRIAQRCGPRIYFTPLAVSHTLREFSIMGKKKVKGEYNDFLDGEKLRDNADVRTSLQGSSATTTAPLDASPSQARQQDRKGGRGSPNKSKNSPKKPQLTHFLCLPLVNEESRPQFELGLNKIKEDLSQSGLVPLKAVRPLGTLHLTLGVMSLDPSQLSKAQTYLEQLDLAQLLHDIPASTSSSAPVSDPGAKDTLRISLEALVPMQKPAQTSILYAEPRDASGRLRAFAQAVRKRFESEGLLVQDNRELRLHATIINTLYAKPKGRREKKKKNNEGDDAVNDGEAVTPSPNTPPDSSTGTNTRPTSVFDGKDGHGPNAKNWMRFDARDLMAQYTDFVWARDVRVDRVHLCKMGAAKVVDGAGDVVDERYEVVAERVM